MQTVTIDDDFGSWRTAARRALIAQLAPDQIEWRTTDSGPAADARQPRAGFLFDDPLPETTAPCLAASETVRTGSTAVSRMPALVEAGDAVDAVGVAPADETNASDATAGFAVPRDVLKRIRTAARASDPQRWSFLYRVVWRYAHGDHAAVLPGDIDGERLTRMARQVTREFHHWRAFLRFSETSDADDAAASASTDAAEAALPVAASGATDPAAAPALVAWCEPEHDILEPLARYFEKRLGRARWMIATPDGVARHDRDGLDIDRSAPQKRPASQDEVEQLWRTYFRSIFNPARVNPALTRQHLPLRYWKHLPEGDLIPRLAAEATTGQRRHAQAPTLRGNTGKQVAVSAHDAQPQRDAATSLDTCRRCPLWEHATQAVGGVGPANATLMLVGEQPGDQEDLSGKPFVGPAGQLLDRAMASADVPRERVYVTNAVKHFKWEPRGKRRLHKTPAQREIDACHVWLEQEIAAHRPRVVVALGATALKSLSAAKAKLSSVLNQPYEQDGMWIVPTYHPSYALRVPDAEARAAAERTIVEALARARELLEAHGT
ncbi:UdgX family uracil-DNA binding protein [Chitinasiproducens palmae]|uniref:Type-4 uracil-DNA glycosylase n=1 Tax=Chitinasiproducens palmae TaxID=1770053 RepID=A0A1H2PK48_9BURK|nr:UdgX family uracil-DNA binding protein [Chitinasiproducens palmae]SDV46743.1 DNA polymerase [Chitinasiproducens palmae]